MVTAATIGLLSLAAWVAFHNWRQGIFVAILVALLQDVLRKLTPDQPVSYVLMVGAVFGAAMLDAMMSGISLRPGRIWGWRRFLAAPFGFFVAVILLQAFNSFSNFGNVVIPLIGSAAYLTPFLALGLLYNMVIRSDASFPDRVLKFYVVFIFFGLTTIYLEYIGYDWPIFGEVGRGLIIFDKYTGAMLSAYSGLFRSSEVAAWHAATCVCFFIIVIANRRLTPITLVAAAVFVLIVVALGMVTGRRKFLVEILVFGSAYTALLLYFGRGAKLAFLAGFIGLIGFLSYVLIVPETPTEHAERTIHLENKYGTYIERTKSVFADIPARFREIGIAPISWAYRRYGLLGAGLGAGSQGVQHFGASAQGSAEGGLGKVWLELGIFGFITTAWLAWAFARLIWKVLRLTDAQSAPIHRLACGLASFILANVATFVVATQVYGDIFVLLMLGTASGTLLALPVLASRSVLQERLLRLAPDSRVPPTRQSGVLAVGDH